MCPFFVKIAIRGSSEDTIEENAQRLKSANKMSERVIATRREGVRLRP